MDGFIKVYRTLFEHPLWSDKPFARGQAWIDLLQLASISDQSTFVKGREVTVRRGQVFRSIESLADRWGWSQKKVRAYLAWLKSKEMVSTDGTPQGTLITIEKYEEYNTLGQESDSTEDTPEGTTREQRGCNEGRRNKKEKKDKTDKKEKNNIRAYGEFQNVMLTDDEYTKLVERFPRDYQERIENLSAYLKSKGRRYKDHYATILAWDRREKKKQDKPVQEGRLDWIDAI